MLADKEDGSSLHASPILHGMRSQWKGNCRNGWMNGSFAIDVGVLSPPVNRSETYHAPFAA